MSDGPTFCANGRLLSIVAVSPTVAVIQILITIVFSIRLRRLIAKDERGTVVESGIPLLTLAAMALTTGVIVGMASFKDDSCGYDTGSWMSKLFLYDHHLALTIAGLVLGHSANLLLIASIIALGPSWRPVVTDVPNIRLVTSGPFRLCRHPLYLADLMFATTTLLLTDSIVAAGPLFLLFLYDLIYRIPREEALLARACGEEYRLYRDSLGAFLPFSFPCCFPLFDVCVEREFAAAAQPLNR